MKAPHAEKSAKFVMLTIDDREHVWSIPRILFAGFTPETMAWPTHNGANPIPQFTVCPNIDTTMIDRSDVIIAENRMKRSKHENRGTLQPVRVRSEFAESARDHASRYKTMADWQRRAIANAYVMLTGRYPVSSWFFIHHETMRTWDTESPRQWRSAFPTNGVLPNTLAKAFSGPFDALIPSLKTSDSVAWDIKRLASSRGITVNQFCRYAYAVAVSRGGSL